MKNSSELLEKKLEQITNIGMTKSFLGREFLTWLWFQVETRASHDGMDRFADLSTDLIGIDVWLDDRLLLIQPSISGYTNLMKGGDPSKSDEARVALAGGKSVQEARIGMRINGVGEFSCVLKGEDLVPRSLKLPENQDDPSADYEPILARVELVEKFYGVLDRLFDLFLEDRLRKDWESEGLVRIRKWILGHKRLDKGALH